MSASKTSGSLVLMACISCFLLVGLNSCRSSTDSNVLGIGKKYLGQEESLRIKRFLHPMPQELRISQTAYQVPANECGIKISQDASAEEKQMVADFKERWRIKHGADLKENDARLTIVAGVLKNSPVLQKSAENGVFDAEYLAGRPNSEQAYTIATVAEGEGTTVYIAANDNPGLYYGLLTFEQLLDGLSKNTHLIFPHCNIIDWPDIRWRGSWTALEHSGKSGDDLKVYCEKGIREFSELKLNMIEAWYLRPIKFDEAGNVVVNWNYPKEIIAIGRRYAVNVFPGSCHIAVEVKRVPAIEKRLFHVRGKAEKPDIKNTSICYNQPDIHAYLTQYLTAIARQFDFADIWMSETEGSTGVCHCEKCKGDTYKAFIAETKSLMAAYAAAKKENPKFRIMLGLTQGSYPHNLAMLKYIPKDVMLNFYSSKMTYRTTFQTYNLPPSLQEMKRLGFTLGSTPSPAPWAIFYPFQTPQYIRLLCGEAEDRDLEFVSSQFWPNPFFWEVNSGAFAEFLWNSKGRTAKEFTAAWATRRGLKYPDENAAVIEMMEYPERGFHNCVFFRDILPEIVDFVAGKERATYGGVRGYELKTYEEAARIMRVCEEAKARAAKLDNPELLAACEVMCSLVTILDRYAYCAQNSKDEQGKEKAIRTIKEQFKLYPGLFKKWLAMKKPSQYAQTVINRGFNKQWEAVLALEQKAVSRETKELIEAEKQGKLTVVKLNPVWKFKLAVNDAGLTDKWFSIDFDDKNWPLIKAGKGYGWEKQGYDGYTGYAWYRQKTSVTGNMNDKKHLYLIFNGVDEDAEVFVNGKQMFTHSYETAGGSPGATWNKPFSFDAKLMLKSGADNTIAVRVYNRTEMGGIWKPVYLIATDQAAKTEDLLVVASQLENERSNDLENDD